LKKHLFLNTRTKLLTPILLLAILVSQRPLSKEAEFVGYNCAITPPDRWELLTNLPPQPGLIVAFRNSAQTSLLLVLVDERNKPDGPIDQRFVINFEKGVEQSGVGKRVSGRFIQVAGVKGYERVGTAVVNGRKASTITDVVAADDRFYSIQAMRFDGEAGDDPEIRKALASFRFLTPPSLPMSRSNSAAYRFGYFVGAATGVVLIIAVVLVVVVVIIRATKRPVSRRAPEIPPPLPPAL
jgi:hypothetical protein